MTEELDARVRMLEQRITRMETLLYVLIAANLPSLGLVLTHVWH